MSDSKTTLAEMESSSSTSNSVDARTHNGLGVLAAAHGACRHACSWRLICVWPPGLVVQMAVTTLSMGNISIPVTTNTIISEEAPAPTPNTDLPTPSLRVLPAACILTLSTPRLYVLCTTLYGFILCCCSVCGVLVEEGVPKEAANQHTRPGRLPALPSPSFKHTGHALPVANDKHFSSAPNHGRAAS